MMDMDDIFMPVDLPEGVKAVSGYVKDKRLGLAPKVKIYLRRHPEYEVYEWRPIEIKISEHVTVEVNGHDLYDAIYELITGDDRMHTKLIDMPKERE